MAAWSQQSGLANAAILAAFGQPVSYQQGAGDPFTVIGILDKRTDEQRHPDTVYARLFVALSGFRRRRITVMRSPSTAQSTPFSKY